MSFDANDLLWLLLPLAAASGWYVARLEQRRRVQSTLDLPSAYFKGLNFLLNEQPDKAIEVFIRVLEVNSDTVETHLALGNLFRRRGEVERAIRIHQNLIARPTLDKEQRSQALLELGQDYFKAGLFDRAENLFLELAEIRAHSELALRMLLHIYQQEKEWEKSISVVRKLARASGRNLDNMVAHFFCELAEMDVARNNRSSARDRLKQALAADDKCVRASILLGDVDVLEGNHPRAIEQWQQIEKQDIHYLGEVAERIAEAFRQLGDEQGLYDYFNVALRRHGGVSLALTFADVISSREGVEAAEKFIIEWLRRTPNVHGLHKLLELNLIKAKDSARNDLLMLKGIIEELRTQHLGYACGECGFKGKALHWMCPGCNHWNTIKPVQEE
ncbi:MAG: lipopolysaccharide assembly protein LapB [Sulfuricaulis sp.]|uniref:lipopolysaccharide assembly protein LapB n=1 Tax=Sulfuricaulis sp. TaxID=2003553 RepID=UPI0025D0C160|nr:lipopolysaccharide assembly protein LapB [Sulfuricaulis sp.]MCR4348044.1 lipopolysaccharide assembly protein LapB [Sulfuricaulis sp.]